MLRHRPDGSACTASFDPRAPRGRRSDGPVASRPGPILTLATLLLLAPIIGSPISADAQALTMADEPIGAPHRCSEGVTLATGRADRAIFSPEASHGVVAFWCETYDEAGHAHRDGPYWDHHPDGSLRTRASYVDGRLEGPVEVFEDGTIWLRGALASGEWSGDLELFDADGRRWLSARYRHGRPDGSTTTGLDAPAPGLDPGREEVVPAAPTTTSIPLPTPSTTPSTSPATAPPADAPPTLPMARLEHRSPERGDGRRATPDSDLP